MGAHAAAPGASGRPLEFGRMRELVVHLALREASSVHRFTLLGWAWPLVRQLAYLAVLVLVFTEVLDLGIPDYPAFVFSGLIAFTWFTAGIGSATVSLVTKRHLLFQSSFPPLVLPLVAVAVPLVDVLIAMPVLIAMLTAGGELHASALFAPVLALIQLTLMAGLAWLLAAAHVYLRDVGQIVAVGLTLLFYVTPVFYNLERVPADWEWVIRLNPMSTLVDGYHAVFLDGRLPAAGEVAALAGASLIVAVAGFSLFRRLSPGFVDEL